jgi:hypothetical protein
VNPRGCGQVPWLKTSHGASRLMASMGCNWAFRSSGIWPLCGRSSAVG